MFCKTVTIYEPELFSDAMDRARSAHFNYIHMAIREAERANVSIDNEVVERKALASAIKAYAEELSSS
jgi:hypothetical protein